MAAWFWPASTSENSFVVRIGRVLHWLGYGVAVLILAANLFSTNAHVDLIDALVLASAIAIVGRLARYVLASE